MRGGCDAVLDGLGERRRRLRGHLVAGLGVCDVGVGGYEGLEGGRW